MTETVGEFCYNKKDLIGHGAFAVVFKGHHRKKPDFVVAVKVISKKNLSKTQSLLAKEIKILKELQHENVVALFDCQERPNSVYLVMEFCNGGDLADYLQDKGTLSEDTIRLFLQQIASAMHVLQSKGIVHRDLKPQNLLLSHSGGAHPVPSDIKVKIADFGFARFLPGEMMAATLCGSPMYMAPEVIMSKAYDARADLWSLGTIVYQCLTGKAPFLANSPQALKKFYEKNKSVCPIIPAGTSSHIKHLLMGLLKRNPKDRMDFGEFFSHPFLTGGNPYRTSTPVAVPSRQRNYSGSSQGTSSGSPSYSAEALGDIRVDLLRRMTPPYDVTGTSPQDPPTVIQVSGERSPNTGRTRKTSGTFMYSPPRPTLDEEPEPEDFVMVPTSIDFPDGTPKARYSWNPSPPYGQSPPSNSPFQPSPLTSPRRATFVIGSPASPPTPRRSRTYSTGSRHSPTTQSPQLTPGQSPVTQRNRSSSSPGLPPPSTPPSTQSSTPIPVPRRATFAGLPNATNQPKRKITLTPPPTTSPGPEQKRVFSPSPKGLTPVITTTPPKDAVSPRRKTATTGLMTAAKALTEQGEQYAVTNIGTGALARQDPAGRSPGTIQRAMTNMERGPSETSPILSALARQNNTGIPVPLGTLAEAVEEKPIMRVHSSPAILATAAIGLPRNRAILNTGAFQFATHGAAIRRNASTGSYTPFHQGLNLESSPPQPSPPSLSPIPGSPTKSLQSIEGSDKEMKPLKGLFTGSSPPSPAMMGGDIIPFKSLPRSNQSEGSKPPSLAGDQPVMVSPGTKITHGFSETSPVSPRRTSFSQEVEPCSPEMEGTIALIAPELPEDTLMETEHTDGVRKLNFAMSLADAILEVIRARSAPLTTLADSMALRMNESLLSDQLGFISEECRTTEQLVLYLKALRVLSLTLRYAQEELKDHRLKPSNAVKNVVNDLTNRYRQCLDRTSQIKSSLQPRVNHPNEKTITANADKLMYMHAMELCQNAALDELFGNPKECRQKYETAQLLLQGLECDANQDTDLALLQRYKISVDRRLTQLSRRRTSSMSGR